MARESEGSQCADGVASSCNGALPSTEVAERHIGPRCRRTRPGRCARLDAPSRPCAAYGYYERIQYREMGC
eukprot:532682-Pleurochrysis_carterae.AAC.2